MISPTMLTLHLFSTQVSMPHLTSGHLWRASGRLETMGPELITFEDRARRVQVLSCAMYCTELCCVLY